LPVEPVLPPDGRLIYVLDESGTGLKLFARDPRSGGLRQRLDPLPCAGGAPKCLAPDSVSFSPSGRFAYLAFGNEANELGIYGRDSRSGTLVPVSPPSGCLSKLAESGCDDARAFNLPSAPSFSADGRSAYISTGEGAALTVFSADAPSGLLTQLLGPDGCTTHSPREDCAVDPLVYSAYNVTVAPDGRHAYAVGGEKNGVPALVEFARDRRTGALARIACVAEPGVKGCGRARGLRGLGSIALSANGKTLYAAAWLSHAVASFHIAGNGTLEQLRGRDGCLSASRRERGCRTARGLFQPELEVSRDGRNVYVVDDIDVGADSGDIVALATDRHTGALRELPSPYGCMNHDGTHGCARYRGLRGNMGGPVLSPDGRYLYVVSDAFVSEATLPTGSIAVFRRRIGR
jgi:hypothetical protein